MSHMRQWIRVVTEAQASVTGGAAQRYYHGSKRRFRRGFVLLPQTEGYLTQPDVVHHEALFERYRPAHCLPRSQSVFMVGDPDEIDSAGGYEDYVYEVLPEGVIEKNDMGWYSEISVLLGEDMDMDDPKLIEVVRNYWDGVPYRDLSHSLWEYRSPTATVMRLVSRAD